MTHESDDSSSDIGIDEIEENMIEPEDMETESMSSSDDSDENNVKNNQRAHGRPYSLLSFGMTRWYSAWTVMERFYSLQAALYVLMDECETNKKYKSQDFVECMNAINIIELKKILHYLRPLVQAIDYFQRDSSLHMDVLPVLNRLREYYDIHTKYQDYETDSRRIIKVPKEVMDQIFEPRIALFSGSTHRIGLLFNESIAKNLPSDEDARQREASAFVDTLKTELEEYCEKHKGGYNAVLRNQLMHEATLYVKDYDRRVGLSISEYLSTSSNNYKHLKLLYQDYTCKPATSAAVERSFSVQGCFLSPRKMKATLHTNRYQMIIKINCLLAEKYGWD